MELKMKEREETKMELLVKKEIILNQKQIEELFTLLEKPDMGWVDGDTILHAEEGTYHYTVDTKNDLIILEKVI
jgi:hypothetical protein